MQGEVVEFSHFARKNPSSQVSIGLGRSKKCPSCKSRSKAFSNYSFQLILLPFPPQLLIYLLLNWIFFSLLLPRTVQCLFLRLITPPISSLFNAAYNLRALGTRLLGPDSPVDKHPESGWSWRNLRLLTRPLLKLFETPTLPFLNPPLEQTCRRLCL